MSFLKHIFNKEQLSQITLEDVERLITDMIEEFLYLDYEEIPYPNIKYDGLAKQISGFLNSSGGIVVFGVSETHESGRHLPHKITWGTIEKETLENNLYKKVDPWQEDIQIHAVQNPENATQRIFVVYVPKSKNPPHMASNTYYLRLNFQTQPMDHGQVSAIFRRNYLQRHDLINNIYCPLYNELASNLDKNNIEKWNDTEYKELRKNKLYLWNQGVDSDLRTAIEGFYKKMSEWNKALETAKFRLAQIINDEASSFYGEKLPRGKNESEVKIEIRGESTSQTITIDEAVLNKRDPIDFWKERYPFDSIFGTRVFLEPYGGSHKRTDIEQEEFRKFMKTLIEKVGNDQLVRYVWTTLDEIQSQAEMLLEDFEKMME